MRTSDDNRRELYPTCHGVIRPLFNLRVVSLFFLLTVGVEQYRYNLSPVGEDQRSYYFLVLSCSVLSWGK